MRLWCKIHDFHVFYSISKILHEGRIFLEKIEFLTRFFRLFCTAAARSKNFMLDPKNFMLDPKNFMLDPKILCFTPEIYSRSNSTNFIVSDLFLTHEICASGHLYFVRLAKHKIMHKNSQSMPISTLWGSVDSWRIDACNETCFRV